MDLISTIFYTAIMIGVLVFIHEFGHFIAAKLTGMRVDRFSIGFPPRAFGKKIGDTDYCVSWIPVGGYVKIAGMIDESMDTEFLNAEPQPWEFRSKPMWARMLVISAGVIMNLLLALVIFWGIHVTRGTYIAETTEIGYVFPESGFAEAGLIEGDRILSVNGKQVKRWAEAQNEIYIENLGEDIVLEIERNGRQEHISVPAKLIPAPSDTNLGMMVAHTSTVIETVDPQMPAYNMGLRANDTLLTVNDTTVNQMKAIAIIRGNAGKDIKASWKRGSDTLSGTATVTDEGRIGIRIGSVYTGPSSFVRYSVLEAFGEAVADIRQSVHLVYLTFSKIFTGKASVKESLGGPIAIAQLTTQTAEIGILAFLWFMAQLSISLALLNILPIPALDGGHLIILIYEKLFRREVPQKVKIALQQVGFILLLAFMAFIIYNDISRF
jgi:regulator of sigma E protease